MLIKTTLLAATCAAVCAAPAAASSIAYTQNDNVWLTTPDGSYQKQVTTDGTSSNRYQAPDQADDGSIVVSRPSPRFIYRVDQNGATKNAPVLAPGNSCGTGPLDLDVTPQGGLVVFQYVHSDYCFNPTPGNGPRSRVRFAFSDSPTLPATFGYHDGWTAPRWTPGTDVASMVAIGGGSVGIQGGGTVSPWLTTDTSVEKIDSFDVSRTGNRVLVETVPVGGGPSALVVWQNDGVPVSTGNTGSVVCVASDFAPGGDADPRWSPDGSQIAWEGADGVYASPAPVAGAGGACVLAPQLVAAGGHDPAWGVADVARPAEPGGGETPGGGDQPGGNSGNNGGGSNAGGDSNGGDQQPPPAADTVAPSIALGSATGVRLRNALRKGLSVPVTLSESATVSGSLTIAGPTGRKLGLAAAPIKVASGKASGTGEVTLRLRFTAKARKRLAKLKVAKLTLQVAATDGVGNQSRATPKKVTLKR